MKILLTIIALTFSIAAQAQVKYVSLIPKSQDYKVSDKDEITVYMSKRSAPKKHKAIGYIICKKNSDKKSFKKAKKQAAKHGADAIYLFDEKDRTGMDKALNTLFGTGHKDEMKFIAIQI